MTISEETRERVVQAYLSGKGSMPYIADMFGVSLPSVKNGFRCIERQEHT